MGLWTEYDSGNHYLPLLCCSCSRRQGYDPPGQSLHIFKYFCEQLLRLRIHLTTWVYIIYAINYWQSVGNKCKTQEIHFPFQFYDRRHFLTIFMQRSLISEVHYGHSILGTNHNILVPAKGIICKMHICLPLCINVLKSDLQFAKTAVCLSKTCSIARTFIHLSWFCNLKNAAQGSKLQQRSSTGKWRLLMILHQALTKNTFHQPGDLLLSKYLRRRLTKKLTTHSRLFLVLELVVIYHPKDKQTNTKPKIKMHSRGRFGKPKHCHLPGCFLFTSCLQHWS